MYSIRKPKSMTPVASICYLTGSLYAKKLHKKNLNFNHHADYSSHESLR
jgi:hypothetical protein